MNTTTTAPAATEATCLCGCGNSIGKRSSFRPGHDAKFVSLLVQDLVRGDFNYTNERLGLSEDPRNDIQYNMDQFEKALQARTSQALASKFVNAAHNEWAKANREQITTAKNPNPAA